MVKQSISAAGRPFRSTEMLRCPVRMIVSPCHKTERLDRTEGHGQIRASLRSNLHWREYVSALTFLSAGGPTPTSYRTTAEGCRFLVRPARRPRLPRPANHPRP